MYFRRTQLRLAIAFACLTLTLSLTLAQTAKRPLNHHDYDTWRTIAGQRIANNGKFLAYSLLPEEGDGEVVIRNLVTGQETRIPAGARPVAPAAATEEEEAPPTPRGVTIEFSTDSKTVVFSTFPSKADTNKAKKEKKTPDQMPKDGMVIVDLASGSQTRIERVRRFALPLRGNGYLAYLREAPEGRGAADAPKPDGGDYAGDQQGGRGGRGGRGGGGGGGPRLQFGTDLVLRSLTDAAERTFSDAAEFMLTEDGKQLVYAVSARDTSKNGVFAVATGSSAAPVALLTGKGKYEKLTADENQTEIAFLSDKDDAASKPSKFKLYRWDRQAPTATELVSTATPGFHKDYVISENGNLSFSKDGKHVYFGCAPPAPEKKDAATADPTEEKAVVDLWSYKDDYLQPQQKLRAARDRNRTFMAAYSIPEHKLIQLADEQLEAVTPSENTQWVLGTDDRDYRKADDYDEHYSDTYLIDTTTGTRKLLAKKHTGQVSFSPNGRYMLMFDGKDWSTASVPDGKISNLTSKLPVKFFNEETDTPSLPNSYGVAGWTKDGKSVLLYDHYDIWQVSPDRRRREKYHGRLWPRARSAVPLRADR